MPKKNDMDKLLAREERGRNLVASIAGVSDEQEVGLETKEEKPVQSEKRRVVRPVIKETRSAKFQALFTPSLKKKAETKASKSKLSLNEVLNQLLEDWIENDN
ncbi:hypothetical protein LJC74_10345 [Eubacteriales bacterium OttesenSCG-928-A19]|nr:hypothetical protein [Eubacteriales bacterium OttesenSCG-928-A19]